VIGEIVIVLLFSVPLAVMANLLIWHGSKPRGLK
jgi:hypothetical protein